MSSIDGQSVWRDLMNRLDEETRRDYFRLTIELSGPEPALDDFTSIDTLSEAVRLHPNGKLERYRTIMALLISCFYLELDSMPSYDGGMWYCSGTIRCRSSGAVKAVVNLCQDGLEFMNGPTSLSYWISKDDICSNCGRYSRPIHFFTRSLDEQVSICVRWGHPVNVRNLSAMPQRLSWFIQLQHLDAPFGTAAHGKGSHNSCSSCGQRPRHAFAVLKRQRSISPSTRRTRLRNE